MDYRKNFVKAIFAVADMDKLLTQMNEVFTDYHKLVIAKGKGEIDQDYFLFQIKQLAEKRNQIFKKYQQIANKINDIKQEFGGQIKE